MSQLCKSAKDGNVVFLCEKLLKLASRLTAENKQVTLTGSARTKQYLALRDTHGRIHNDDGPAVYGFWPNGNLQSIIYMVNGVQHRDDGPAALLYDEDGIPDNEVYFKNGLKIRTMR